MKQLKFITLTGGALTLALSGCSTMEPDDKIAQLQSELKAKEQKASMLEQEVADLKTNLASADSKVNMQQQDTMAAQGAQSGSALIPPNARPGECFARVVIPARYESTTEQVVEQEAGENIEIIPARYEMVDEQVLVRPETERLEVIPAKYGTVEERVLVKAAEEQIMTDPPIYENVSERVLVSAASKEWKKGRGPIEKIDGATGEILCLVEIPAQYKTVTKRVLKKPASTRTVTIPAEYRTVQKRTVIEPPQVKKIMIPAEYKTMKVRKQVAPPQQKRVTIPAKYGTVTKRTKVGDETVEWRSILCETNTTAGVVMRLQQALQQAGHNPGAIDGRLGSQTMAAVQAYQRKKGLARGQVTVETLKSLNVSL